VSDARFTAVTVPGQLTDIPYSPAVVAGGMVYVAGQIAMTPDGTLLGDDIRSQTRAVFASMAGVLEAAGASLRDVVMVNTHLVSAADFDGFNEVYAEVFSPPYPARATVLSGLLAAGCLIESTAVAVKPGA